MPQPPSAWDDDWIAASSKTTTSSGTATNVLTKTERKAEHASANRRLWDSAENPQRFHFLESKSDVPLKDEIKPQVKVLARKPTRGTGGSSRNPELDEDSDDEQRRSTESPLQRQQRMQREREEKARKYAEARERIMGSASPARTPSPSTHGHSQAKSSNELSTSTRSRATPSRNGMPLREPRGPDTSGQSNFASRTNRAL